MPVTAQNKGRDCKLGRSTGTGLADVVLVAVAVPSTHRSDGGGGGGGGGGVVASVVAAGLVLALVLADKAVAVLTMAPIGIKSYYQSRL